MSVVKEGGYISIFIGVCVCVYFCESAREREILSECFCACVLVSTCLCVFVCVCLCASVCVCVPLVSCVSVQQRTCSSCSQVRVSL